MKRQSPLQIKCSHCLAAAPQCPDQAQEMGEEARLHGDPSPWIHHNKPAWQQRFGSRVWMRGAVFLNV